MFNTTEALTDNAYFALKFSVSWWLWAVMGPLLLVLGTVGSVMTVVVMRRLTSGHSTP
jgi:hypothetical protein